MFRFHVARLLRAREEAEGRVIPLRELSAATGVSVSVLSNLASPRPGATTNSRYIEALCRFFGVTPCELLELQPPLDAGGSCHVDALYPGTAQPPETPAPPPPTPEAPATAVRRRRAKRS